MKNSLVLILSFLTAQFSYAGILGNSIFIEPYLGYKVENLKLTDLLSTVTEIKTSVPSLGLKFGYRSMMGVDINVVGEIAQGSADITAIPEKNKFSHKYAGFQLGVNSLGFVKMYLGSSFINDFTIEESNFIQTATYSGSNYQAGVLFKFFPLLNLGLQYNLNQYDTVKGNAYTSGSKLESYFSKINTQDYSVYISTAF